MVHIVMKKRLVWVIVFIFSSNLLAQVTIKNFNGLALTNSNLSISASRDFADDTLMISFHQLSRNIKSEIYIKDTSDTEFSLKQIPAGTYELNISNKKNKVLFQSKIRIIPGWVSLLPPLIAIFLALVTRQVLISLFLGIFSGAFILYEYNFFTSFARMLDTILIQAINSPEKISIIIFSLVLGGVVGIISRNGGTYGIVESLRRIAVNRKRGSLAAYLMGIFIFFDDYANTLIVGNTMRPLTDRLKISREKLAYLIDSTAAPVANIAIISTWIGYELSILADNLHKVDLDYNPYLFFIKSISYNFYPIFSIIFIFVLILMNKDFGPMFHSEKRAYEKNQLTAPDALPLSNFEDPALKPAKNIPLKWYNGMIPILTIIFITVIGLVLSGLEKIDINAMDHQISFIRKISLVVGASNSFNVLLWASFGGTIIAIIMTLSQRLLNLHQTIEAWIAGIKAMVPAALILSSAWAIGNICSEVKTADYVIQLSHQYISVHFLPSIIFITAALISFSTGTSWGTMAILLPITIPLSHQLANVHRLDAGHHYTILLVSFTSVLAGATFGDHCSPISDTTIMSSMAAGSDHIDHVRTQLPYAITVALMSIVFGYIPAGFDIPAIVSIAMGIIASILIIKILGKSVES